MQAHARRWLIALATAAWLVGGSAIASGLQVSPTLLSLQARQAADGLWLSNTGDSPLHAQVRVYRWTQEGGEEQLVPSRDLVISPPMLALDAGRKQLVRVIRVSAPPQGASETAYRVILDELPTHDAKARGLQFVLRYSVPVFVEPAAAKPGPAQLQWSLEQVDGKAVLSIRNTGGMHAQIVELGYTDTNKRHTSLGDGLFGYVLPGASMHWTLKAPAAAFAHGGTFEAMINGEKATQNLSLANRPR